MKKIGLCVAIKSAIVGLSVLLGCCHVTDYHREGQIAPPTAQGKGNQYLYSYYDPDTGYYGYMDNTGKVVISPQFDHGQEIFDRLGFVKIKGKYRFIDRSGKPLIFLAGKDEPTESEEGDKENAPALPRFKIRPFELNKKGEIIFTGGNWLFPDPFNEGLAYLENGKHWGFIDASGKMVIGPFSKNNIILPEGNGFCEGLIKVWRVVPDHCILNDIPAYMNRRGEIVIECDIDEHGDFHDGMALIRKSELYGYIDKQGRIAIEPKFRYASSFWKGTAVVGIRSLAEVRSPQRPSFPIERNRRTDQDFAVINKKGEILRRLGRLPPGWEICSDFLEGLAAVKVPTEYGFDRYGFIDSDLNLAIRPEFNWVFYDLGFVSGIIQAWNDNKGLHGYINRKGEWIRSWGQGRTLTFVFRDASAQELVRTLNSIASGLFEGPRRKWVYPNKEQFLLEIYLEESVYPGIDIPDVDMSLWNLEKQQKLEEAVLGTGQSRLRRSSAERLKVGIAYGTEAEEALTKFALHILKAHPGGIYEWDFYQTWTLEEVESNSNSKGFPFKRLLEKPTIPS